MENFIRKVTVNVFIFKRKVTTPLVYRTNESLASGRINKGQTRSFSYLIT